MPPQQHLGLLRSRAQPDTRTDLKVIPLGLASIGFGLVSVGVSAFNFYKTLQQGPREKIRFDYLPASPLRFDWQCAYGDLMATFAKDKAVRDAMKRIVAGGFFAMGYRIAPTLPCDRLRFDAKSTESTMIITQAEITKDKKQTSKTVWIKYYVGSKPAKKDTQFCERAPARIARPVRRCETTYGQFPHTDHRSQTNTMPFTNVRGELLRFSHHDRVSSYSIV